MSNFKNLYMRQHSNVARKWSKDSLNARLYMQEDPIFEVLNFLLIVYILIFMF